MMFSSLARKINELTIEVDNRKSLDIAIETANELITLLNPQVIDLKNGEDALDENIPVNKFPNYKAESWFAQHPYFSGERVALNFYETDEVEVKFYWLGDTATKARVSAGVMLAPNWEDSDLTRNDQYKVGIDFFLSANTKSLLMVVSNNGNLRILEFSDRLSNTQQDILQKLRGVLALSSKEQIHKTMWDSLALSEVNKKFYLGIAEKFNELHNHLVAESKDAEDAKLFASRLLGRLLFIWFLRRKNIIEEQYGYFKIDSPNSTQYYDQKLKKLFFETLNTPESDRQHADGKTPYLNGGLFEAHDNDWSHQKVSFPTGFFDRLYEHLEQYNFTTDESSPEYEQVAIDPEMLGRVFESLLATQVTETGDQARKAKGAFYTPREIVAYMCKESLRQYLYTRLDNENQNEGIDKLLDISDSEWELQHTNAKRNLWGEKDRNTVPAQVLQALDDLKVLDPACGSGAFPMGMLQLMLKTYERLDSRFDAYRTKLRIVQENIYGVDIEPMAVEISRLRAWLSLVVDDEDDNRVEPLPNLDFKFVCANSLFPLEQQTGLFADATLHEKLAEVRAKFFNARKPTSKDKWKTEYFKLTGNGQNSLLGDQRENQLKSFNPFNNSNPAEFFDSDYMFGLLKFDVIIGNPPYVKNGRMDKDDKSRYMKIYTTPFDQWDLYILFFEQALNNLHHTGVGCLITPNQYLSAKYGTKLRRILSHRILLLTDFRNLADFDNVSVNTFITLFKGSNVTTEARVVVFDSLGGNSRELINRADFVENSENLGTMLSSDFSIVKRIVEESATTVSKYYDVGHSFSIPDFYKLSPLIYENQHPDNDIEIKLVSTGTIGLWGKKPFKYDGKNYQHPTIKRSDFDATFPTRHIQTEPGLIISSMGGLKVFMDKEGKYLGTRPTMWLSPKNNESLDIIHALLTSKFISWFYSQQYSVAGMTGFKVRFGNIKQTPFPVMTEEQKLQLMECVTSNNREAVDKCIYELYSLSPEEIAIVENGSHL